METGRFGRNIKPKVAGEGRSRDEGFGDLCEG